jgi:hypothetical protein
MLWSYTQKYDWPKVMRLPVLIVTAGLVLALLCGEGNATGYEMSLPTIDNPYCSVTTYLLPNFPEQAMSAIDSSDRPIIVISALTLRQSSAYGKFLMAHECCHHTLGHVNQMHGELGHLGPQPFYYIAPALKQMELDADCCAVRMLKQTHELDAIEAARQAMAKFGTMPTGAYYPTGLERMNNIAKCAAKD